jgi:hypothetical protein
LPRADRFVEERFAVDRFAVDLFVEERFVEERFAEDRLADDPRVDDRLADDRFAEEPFLAVERLRRDELPRDGTFAPFSRASDSPIAIACSRLVTRPPCPRLPRRSVPRLRRRIALSTLFPAARPYLRPPPELPPDFFVAMWPPRSGVDVV